MHDIPRFAHPGFRRQKAPTPGSNDPGVEEKKRRRNNDEHWQVVISSSVFRCSFCDFIIPYKPYIMNKQSWNNYAHYYFLWVISVYFATPLSRGIMKSPDLQLRIRGLHKGSSNNEKALIGSIFRPLQAVSLIDLIIPDPAMKINAPSVIVHAQYSPILKHLIFWIRNPKAPGSVIQGLWEKRGEDTMSSIDR